VSVKVGFIGLGVMGKAMARNLVKAGFAVTVYNRSRGAVDELVAEGAAPGTFPAEVASRCDIVCICVPDTPDVEKVLFAEDGVASAMRRGGVVIDFSTVSGPATVEFARRLAANGVDMLDSPVSGGPKGAVDGTLSCMIGGDAAVLERCMPVFRAVGKTFTHIGGNGAGQLCKACNQLAIIGTAMAVFEALVLARKSGIDPAKVREALLGGSAQSFVLQNHAKRWLDGNLQAGFRNRLMRKDVRLAQSAAREAESFAPIVALAEQVMNSMCATDMGELDPASLGLFYERLSGLAK
jgi:2-hydroxy-3-oxopropionate reductase